MPLTLVLGVLKGKMTASCEVVNAVLDTLRASEVLQSDELGTPDHQRRHSVSVDLHSASATAVVGCFWFILSVPGSARCDRRRWPPRRLETRCKRLRRRSWQKLWAAGEGVLVHVLSCALCNFWSVVGLSCALSYFSMCSSTNTPAARNPRSKVVMSTMLSNHVQRPMADDDSVRFSL